MAENDFERTEAPTPRRRDEARQEGNVARSTDLTAACLLLAAVLMLYVFGTQLLGGFRVTLQRMLEGGAGGFNPTRPDDLAGITGFTLTILLQSVAPFCLGLMLVALLSAGSQVGFLLTAKPLQPKFSRLSPLRGIKNMLDIRAGVRLVMSLAKIALIASLASLIVLGDLPFILRLCELETLPMLAASSRLVFELGLKLAALLLLLAVFDYAFQRWQRERDLRMTKQDVKEELKRMEGDPLIKQRRTRVARQLAMQRIAQAVPKADVVVTNPTHFAVALQYDAQTMNAPKVVAKGADYMAMRIRHLAMIHDVPLVERRELAQALYRTVEVGREVPPQYYNAVAEILAYVFRLSGRGPHSHNTAIGAPRRAVRAS